MEDLSLIAMLFKTSSTLEQAAAALEKMLIPQEKISGEEKEALSWSGEFLLAVDWSAQQTPPKPVTGGLALRATSVRPTFYSCLFRMAPKLKEAGMRNEKDVTAFLGSLYRNLSLHETPGKGHKRLTPELAKLGASLLHDMAESILVQINNNGLPRTTTTLRDEWKPTTNEFNPVLTI